MVPGSIAPSQDEGSNVRNWFHILQDVTVTGTFMFNNLLCLESKSLVSSITVSYRRSANQPDQDFQKATLFKRWAYRSANTDDVICSEPFLCRFTSLRSPCSRQQRNMLVSYAIDFALEQRQADVKRDGGNKLGEEVEGEEWDTDECRGHIFSF